jgi:hypothetical protein
MKTVAIVQGRREICGVYQLGLATYNILAKSQKYQYVLVSAESAQQLLYWLNQTPVDAILYNYYTPCLGWLNSEITSSIAVPQFVITGHEQIGNFDNILEYFLLDPNMRHFKNLHQGYFSNPSVRYATNYQPVPRPVINYDDITYSPSGNKLKIGSFGFAYGIKRFDKIIDLVNEQFTEPVTVNFNIGISPLFTDAVKDIVNNCRTRANSNVELNIAHDFLDSYNMVRFLNNNDINLFYYTDIHHRLGISSCIDLALSAKKPIGVNHCRMFRHVIKSSIDIEVTKIKDIVSQELAPLLPFYDAWSEDNFRSAYERVFERYI